MADEKETELYRNYINAQYEYFKYIEPKRVININKYMEGKIKNPYHWASLAENIYNKEFGTMHIDDEKIKKSKKSYKELMLIIHPDKNSDRIEEATVFFQFIQTLINEDKEDILNDIISAENKWNKIKEIYCDPIYLKKKYCDEVFKSRWYNWCKGYESQYVTQEELEKLMREESDKLEKENEILRKELSKFG